MTAKARTNKRIGDETFCWNWKMDFPSYCFNVVFSLYVGEVGGSGRRRGLTEMIIYVKHTHSGGVSYSMVNVFMIVKQVGDN